MRIPVAVVSLVLILPAGCGQPSSKVASSVPRDPKPRIQWPDPSGLRRDLERTVDRATKDLELEPSSVPSHTERAIARALLGDLPGAQADVSRILELAPHCPEACLAKGMLLFAQKQFPAALQDLTRAMERDPTEPAFYNYRGFIKGSLKDLQGAIADYSKAIELGGSDARTYFNRAGANIARTEGRDPEAALQDLTRAIALNPDSSQYYALRGFVYLLGKDGEGALKDSARAIEMDSRCYVAYEVRAELRRQEGHRAEALRDYQEALKWAPPDWPERPRVVQLMEALDPSTARSAYELFQQAIGRANNIRIRSFVAGKELGEVPKEFKMQSDFRLGRKNNQVRLRIQMVLPKREYECSISSTEEGIVRRGPGANGNQAPVPDPHFVDRFSAWILPLGSYLGFFSAFDSAKVGKELGENGDFLKVSDFTLEMKKGELLLKYVGACKWQGSDIVVKGAMAIDSERAKLTERVMDIERDGSPFLHLKESYEEFSLADE